MAAPAAATAAVVAVTIKIFASLRKRRPATGGVIFWRESGVRNCLTGAE
jgi:hypothetical protein